ncbi:exopolysaccharide biosynthesis protein [Azospirillum sp. sgz302134]
MEDHDRAKASTLLRRLRERITGDKPALGEVFGHLGDRAPGFLLLALAIPAIVPTPGIPAGILFGTVLALVAAQMIAGRDRLRVPGWIARRRVSRGTLHRLVEKAAPMIERAERRLRARHPSVLRAGVLRSIGAVILFLGVLIALPIPFGNTLPGLAVIVIALGLIARDGLAVIAGIGLGAVATGVSVAIIAGSWWAIKATPV